MNGLKRLSLLLLLVAGSCGYSRAEFVSQDSAIEMVGVIDGSTRRDLERALAANPGRTTLRLQSVPGSVDDERSLTDLAGFIRGRGLTTLVPSDGLVSSGGTDMFIMGARRIVEPGACIGVHSWYNSVLGLQAVSAADLPQDAPEHRLYLDFYDAMGISRAFYWFTLNAAGPREAHWMSPQEINSFGLSSVPVPPDGLSAFERARRCWDRLGS
jgi:hypothetical protein